MGYALIVRADDPDRVDVVRSGEFLDGRKAPARPDASSIDSTAELLAAPLVRAEDSGDHGVANADHGLQVEPRHEAADNHPYPQRRIPGHAHVIIPFCCCLARIMVSHPPPDGKMASMPKDPGFVRGPKRITTSLTCSEGALG